MFRKNFYIVLIPSIIVIATAWFMYYKFAQIQNLKHLDGLDRSPTKILEPIAKNYIIASSTSRMIGLLEERGSILYFDNEPIQGMEAVDISTFINLSGSGMHPRFYKDKNHVYVLQTRPHKLVITEMDPETFELLPKDCGDQSNYSKDKNGVYHRNDVGVLVVGEKIEGADPQSFELIYGEISGHGQNCDTSTFFPQFYTYAKDSKNVYYEGKLMKDVDIHSFEPIENGNSHIYARDRNTVYYKDIKINGADPETFRVLWHPIYEGCAQSHYAKDATSVYFKTLHVDGADPNTFEALIYGFGKDAVRVYKEEKLVPNLDPYAFEQKCDYP